MGQFCRKSHYSASSERLMAITVTIILAGKYQSRVCATSNHYLKVQNQVSDHIVEALSR
jgi:hypothetical protein